MKENHKHDLIVTQSVYEFVIPLSEVMAGGAANRSKVSPLGKDMTGCCPTLIVCSEHEATFDEGVVLRKKMEDAGVELTFVSRKHMCHVWCLLPMLPEAGEVMRDVHKFLKGRFAPLSAKKLN